MKLSTLPREAFGEKPRAAQVGVVLLFATVLTVILGMHSGLHRLPLWNSVLALVLIFDICAGAVANFTRSTSEYYAAHRTRKLWFLAVHIHLLIIAWLLGLPLWQAILVWGYTVIGSLGLVLLKREAQVFTGGVLFCIGTCTVAILDMGVLMTIVSLLFMTKVLFAFGIDHYSRV